MAFISCSTDLATQQARPGCANQQGVCVYVVMAVVLKSVLILYTCPNRLLVWFGPVDLQAMLSVRICY